MISLGPGARRRQQARRRAEIGVGLYRRAVAGERAAALERRPAWTLDRRAREHDLSHKPDCLSYLGSPVLLPFPRWLSSPRLADRRLRPILLNLQPPAVAAERRKQRPEFGGRAAVVSRRRPDRGLASSGRSSHRSLGDSLEHQHVPWLICLLLGQHHHTACSVRLSLQPGPAADT